MNKFDELKYYTLHDVDRPVGYQIIITKPTLDLLKSYYNHIKKEKKLGLFIIEEPDNDRNNPGRIKTIFCLAKN